jgi:hypothetical protein
LQGHVIGVGVGDHSGISVLEGTNDEQSAAVLLEASNAETNVGALENAFSFVILVEKTQGRSVLIALDLVAESRVAASSVKHAVKQNSNVERGNAGYLAA